MITFRVDNTATPALNRAVEQLRRPRPLYAAAAKAIIQVLKNWFKYRQAEGNKKRWPPRYFWFGVRNSVANTVGVHSLDNTGAVVTVASPAFAHKVTGGDIVPKRKRFLTIPLNARAYKLAGKGTIRESQPDLFVLRTIKGLWLVKSKFTRGQRRGGRQVKRQTLEFWFRLVKRVTQRPDPRAMPPEGQLTAAAELATIRILPILLRRQGLNAR